MYKCVYIIISIISVYTCCAMVSTCLQLPVQNSGQGSAFNNSPAPFASPRPFSDKSTSTQPGNLHGSDHSFAQCDVHYILGKL